MQYIVVHMVCNGHIWEQSTGFDWAGILYIPILKIYYIWSKGTPQIEVLHDL